MSQCLVVVVFAGAIVATVVSAYIRGALRARLLPPERSLRKERGRRFAVCASSNPHSGHRND